MDILTDKEQEYLRKVRKSAKFLPIIGWGMIMFALSFAIIAGIRYEKFIRHSRTVNSRYTSYLQSIHPTTDLEKKLVKQFKQEKEFNESITKMSFILMGLIGALILGGIISSGAQLLGTGITHRRYLKIIEKINQKE